MPIADLSQPRVHPIQVCHKCAVHFDPMCTKALLFNIRADCFRAGLIVGKLLMFNGAQAWKTPFRLAYS